MATEYARSAVAIKLIIPIVYLRECFDFNAEVGTLTWRFRPREHFPTFRAWRIWNGRYADKQVGTLDRVHGYFVFTLTFKGKKHRYSVHRVIWALAHSCWPEHEIDHINGITTDNLLVNLREATRRQNNQNHGPSRRNSSGYRGVYWDKFRNKWVADITIDYRSHHLGRFQTREEAADAYRKARAKLVQFQPIARDLK